MLSAQTFEIPRDRQAAVAGIGVVERDGVVDVADHRAAVATGEAACHVAHPHPSLHGRARADSAAPRRRLTVGSSTRRSVASSASCADLLGVDHAVSLDVSGFAAAAKNRLRAGDDVDHDPGRSPRRHRIGSGIRRRHIRHASWRPFGHRLHRIGASLIDGARIVAAHRWASSVSRLSKATAASAATMPSTLAVPSPTRDHVDVAPVFAAAPAPGSRRDPSAHRGIDGVDDSLARPAVPRRDPPARLRSNRAITESLTNSVRVMITCTVRQSVSPAASTAATWAAASPKRRHAKP